MRIWLRLVLVLSLATLPACASRPTPPAAGAGAPVAVAAVERFLQLAGEKDYVQMGWVFGTADAGPVIRRWPRPEVEKRMYALASVLQHDSFMPGTGSPVPGRIGTAERFTVSLRQGARTVQVPITVVRGPGQRWFVEQVDLERVTNVR